jgi:hypothetical protein
MQDKNMTLPPLGSRLPYLAKWLDQDEASDHLDRQWDGLLKCKMN